MPRSLPLLAVALFATPVVADDGFTPLFNGKDTTGWTFTLRPLKDMPDAKPDPKNTWSVKDGVLVCTGKPNGYIATEKGYENYTLRLKWRYPTGTEKPNSGVLLHVTGEDRVWPNCVEAQLKGGFAGDFWLNADKAGVLPTIKHDRKDPADKTDRHYLRVEAKDAEKPLGEWNAMEITCQGGDIAVAVNGKVVNTATGCSLTKGRIALQSEGSPVEFKDIEMKK
jgi:hypothetical protein